MLICKTLHISHGSTYTDWLYSFFIKVKIKTGQGRTQLFFRNNFFKKISILGILLVEKTRFQLFLPYSYINLNRKKVFGIVLLIKACLFFSLGYLEKFASISRILKLVSRNLECIVSAVIMWLILVKLVMWCSDKDNLIFSVLVPEEKCVIRMVLTNHQTRAHPASQCLELPQSLWLPQLPWFGFYLFILDLEIVHRSELSIFLFLKNHLTFLLT